MHDETSTATTTTAEAKAPEPMARLDSQCIVDYVLKNGEHRPAIIVRAWSRDYPPYRANLRVFLDGYNDRGGEHYDGTAEAGTLWATSVPYDPTGTEPSSWHWPEEA